MGASQDIRQLRSIQPLRDSAALYRLALTVKWRFQPEARRTAYILKWLELKRRHRLLFLMNLLLLIKATNSRIVGKREAIQKRASRKSVWTGEIAPALLYPDSGLPIRPG